MVINFTAWPLASSGAASSGTQSLSQCESFDNGEAPNGDGLHEMR